MVIDKKLNFDTELEYQRDGNLVFAQNVVLSNDGLAIQNEPAIVKFLTKVNFDMVGFIACNEEFVLFSSDSKIVRISKYGDEKECKTNWHYEGGEVFGTYTYNVNNELIVAISERYLADGVDCPLKVINLDRDEYIEGADDNIYTLTPDIPKSNMVDVDYIQGNRIKKGKYNFFIKYYIEDKFETGWFPIGVPVFAYDNTNASSSKSIVDEHIQATSANEDDGLTDKGFPKKFKVYKTVFDDFYNSDDEYTTDNIKLKFEINDVKQYTHYRIGYIINTGSSAEGRMTSKYYMTTNEIIINEQSEPVSVDELTIGSFNIFNVNTMCNYKDRLYLANYKEENVNKVIKKGISSDNNRITTYGITVSYETDNSTIPEVTTTDYSALRNQWKSKPGKAAIYNFYLHYVYPNGNYTDGIKIGDLSTYEGRLRVGYTTFIDPNTGDEYKKYTYYRPTQETTTDDILNAYSDSITLVKDNDDLYDYLEANPGVPWWTIEGKFYELYPEQLEFDEYSESNGQLRTIINTKGDVLFMTPIDLPFNVSKLKFSHIKLYPEFVGYFISYEKPEYIQIGEGFIIPKGTKENGDLNKYDLYDLGQDHEGNDWKFYYPEFSIVGGKTNVSKLVKSGHHEATDISADFYDAYAENGSYIDKITATGVLFGKNSFDVLTNLHSGSLTIEVDKTNIISPNTFENIGKEAYLEVTTTNTPNVFGNDNDGYQSYTAISKNLNLYLGDNKKLISLGYIKYYNYTAPNKWSTYGEEDVPYNYDFYRCFSSLIFYQDCGIIINQTDSNPINAITGGEYYPYSKDEITRPFRPHIGIIKYWHETHYPLFLKQINIAPDIIFRSYYQTKDLIVDDNVVDSFISSTEQIQLKNLVIDPKYVNELYKLNNVYYDYTGKLLVNYDEDLISSEMDVYTKTIRRSDVIQSESIVNSWKYFRPENYKVITENKGNITNIVGIGNYLFVHCEHSLFMFDISDSLQALDKNVQLLQPDSFEVAYKEVFTADKGYAGLQDFTSWICDEFGYIFYDNSAKAIYRFDSNRLIQMNEGVDKFIKLYQPNYIFMGNDRFNHRILFNLGFHKTIADKTIIDNLILSYSVITNSWISTHSYTTADKFITIKDKIYILDRDNRYDSDQNVTSAVLNINEFDFVNEKDGIQYNDYSILPTTQILNTKNDSSFVDVIFTGGIYNKIKVLDFITYIINKDSYDDGYTNLQLEIYTNCCYSGIIDISQERKRVSEYKKPYYDYERWNFNWFRNVLDKFDNGEIVNRLTGKVIEYDRKVKRGYDNALITGKYAVIRFIFKNINKPVFLKDVQAYFKP